MNITRTTLFEAETLQIGLIDTRPTSDAVSGIEWQSRNVVVLPYAGVFSKLDAPDREAIGTPSHAVFVAAETPYRLGFPGGIGDRALVLRFGEALAPDRLADRPASSGLLPAAAMMRRNLLLRRLKNGEADAFEIETAGLELLDLALGALEPRVAPARHATQISRLRAIERVKEAVAVAPARKWSVNGLAQIAHLSPFHLCHVFRAMVGTSLHDYVQHERLAWALDALLDGGDDLTSIALDAGFSSHSHFTQRFRRFFGCTPTSLRRGEVRTIMTARRERRALA
ncbi:MAG: helix-turn-helix transcriptional regulator [Alphaproteobacteria bacterium]|nr:helix-turn-helix transcriptional regulator [Alphaproteobacteria bacterium]MCW5743894.1 helix-turn-helix transcriptional regulator [Alphaproteobacteria bacterium]